MDGIWGNDAAGAGGSILMLLCLLFPFLFFIFVLKCHQHAADVHHSTHGIYQVDCHCPNYGWFIGCHEPEESQWENIK